MRIRSLPRQFGQLWKLSRTQLPVPSLKAQNRHQAMILWQRTVNASLTRQVFWRQSRRAVRWRSR